MSLHSRRAELREYGVLYPGTTYRHLREIAAVIGRGPRGVPTVPAEEWADFVAEIQAAGAPRTVISSEGLSTAGPATLARIVADLGPDRVHVLRVERRLDRLLPSAWQERIKSSNETRSYVEFLDDVLSADPASAQDKRASFWSAHGLERFLARWEPLLPVEHLHVVVADESDRLAVPAVCERLLGLPAGMLDPTQRPNTSLSWDRVELCRRLNEIFDQHGWPDGLRRRLLQGAVVNGLRSVPEGDLDPRIPRVSGAHLRRTAELSAARVDLLTSSGMDVIGDPELTRVVADQASDERPTEDDTPTTISLDAVAAAVETLLVESATRKRKKALQGVPQDSDS